MVYEIFSKMDTVNYVPGMTFTSQSISNLKLTTKLVEVRASRTKKKGPIHESAFQLLSSIGQVMEDVAVITDKKNDHDDTVTTKELKDRDKHDTLDLKQAKTLEEEIEQIEAALLDDDGNWCTDDTLEEPDKEDSSRKADDKISKKLGYNRFLVEDVWKVGTDRLQNANIKKEREDARARLQRKRDTNRAIVKKFQEKKDAVSEIKHEIECEIPPWRQQMMEMYPNNY